MNGLGYVTVSVLLVVSYLVGRHHGPDRQVSEAQTVQVDRIAETENENKIVLEKITVKPSGETVTVRKVFTDTEKRKAQISSVAHQDKSVKESSAKTTFLIHYDTGRNFGVSASRAIAGPLTIGVFGFFDGRVGASVGFQF